LEEVKVAALKPTAGEPDDKAVITDPRLLREIRDRLYELNFNPGAFDGSFDGSARKAIREFESSNRLAQTGVPTHGLLRKLRESEGAKPWGAISYAKSSKKWGLSWSHGSRKEAVSSAREKCGDAAQCVSEVSFFGTECGAFAHSGTSWSLMARGEVQKARDAALADCRKRSKSCTIIASVCADGSERFSAGN
jgi:hypothetical protein